MMRWLRIALFLFFLLTPFFLPLVAQARPVVAKVVEPRRVYWTGSHWEEQAARYLLVVKDDRWEFVAVPVTAQAYARAIVGGDENDGETDYEDPCAAERRDSEGCWHSSSSTNEIALVAQERNEALARRTAGRREGQPHADVGVSGRATGWIG